MFDESGKLSGEGLERTGPLYQNACLMATLCIARQMIVYALKEAHTSMNKSYA